MFVGDREMTAQEIERAAWDEDDPIRRALLFMMAEACADGPHKYEPDWDDVVEHLRRQEEEKNG